MARYIDADRLINEFTGNGGVFVYGIDTIKAIVSRVNAQPTADVKEVKYGKWKHKRDDYDAEYIICSVCKEDFFPPDYAFDFDSIPKFCPNCGADMRGVDNG